MIDTGATTIEEQINATYVSTEYEVALGKLALFLVPSLLLGLLLRKPMIRFNTFVAEKLEETKLM